MSRQTLRKRLAVSLRRFAACQKGTAAVIFGLAAIPFFACAGAAIDYVHFSAARTHLQAALDSAALAGAAHGLASDADRIAAAEAMFDANVADGAAANLVHDASFTIENGVVVSSAEADVPMSIMQLVGIEKMTASVAAEVGIATDKKAEVVMVLDYSGSMGQVLGGDVKYEAMRQAATTLVNDLATASPDKVKFGLVPFSHHVYTTLPKAHVLGTSGSGSWTGCTQDRKFPHNNTAATPTGSNASKWGQPFAPDHAAWGCSGYVDHNLRTVDLTNDFDSVTNRLAVMTPYAWTHIALGVEFGYHMLSPNAPFTQGAAFNDDETEKFMVVLTDGMQTEPAFGSGSTRSVAQGETNLENLCENAKQDGITIITMAFDLDDTGTRQRLQNCASDPDKYFFVADDPETLASAFDAVKEAVTAEVYLSK
jgi:Flp pilus assembly protein TadG